MTQIPPRLVVLTGGPGAGKTAVLELAQQQFCHHVRVLPESASIIFRGGFPREDSPEGLRCAQRAIMTVQQQLECLASSHGDVRLILCDRGTLDGLAYWPGESGGMLAEGHTTREAELARYAAVIHLRVPPAGRFNRHSNPVRIETADQAQEVDARIEQAWSGHRRRFFVEAEQGFVAKASHALQLIRAELPADCLLHNGTSLDPTHPPR